MFREKNVNVKIDKNNPVMPCCGCIPLEYQVIHKGELSNLIKCNHCNTEWYMHTEEKSILFIKKTW